MTSDLDTPWSPDRRWADPLILLLAMVILFLAALTLQARHRSLKRPAEGVSLQGRILETSLAAPSLLTSGHISPEQWRRAEAQLHAPWDRAMVLILRAEWKDAPLPKGGEEEDITLTGPDGGSFRRAYLAAYAQGPLPGPAERQTLRHHLGDGYAASLLEARLRDREGGGEPLRVLARKALLIRLALLGVLGLLALGFAAGGLGVMLFLWAKRDPANRLPLPVWRMSNRAAALILLGWFLAFFLAGQVSTLLLSPWPSLRWMAIPVGYSLHAAFGVVLLARAEGIRTRDLWRRVAPIPPGRDLAWGIGFLSLAVLVVFIVAQLSGLILKPEQSPQRDLQELLQGLSGWAPSLLLFATVAGLAPWFEELMFRGFVFPLLARRRPVWIALLASSLLFAAIHLQPAGLPTLGALGLVMGLGMRHTGSLRTPILVHACWNGSLFLLMRGLA